MGKLTTVRNRIVSDYLMPSRLYEYEKIIKTLLENDYKILSLKEYKKLLDSNNFNGKYFVNRHDIDTDVTTTKEFFKIEKKFNVKATYYFRLSTLNFEFMQEIEEYGSEASYHFEEIAQFAKDNHIKSKENILDRIDEIKKIFKQNFKMIEEKLGFKLKTVCAHGDFVNRTLKIVNNEITKDKTLKDELGILCEAYDEDILNSFDIYISDKPYPQFYTPNKIFSYIGKKNKICMLSHPRHWKVNWIENTKDNINRVYEGLIW